MGALAHSHFPEEFRGEIHLLKSQLSTPHPPKKTSSSFLLPYSVNTKGPFTPKKLLPKHGFIFGPRMIFSPPFEPQSSTFPVDLPLPMPLCVVLNNILASLSLCACVCVRSLQEFFPFEIQIRPLPTHNQPTPPFSRTAASASRENHREEDPNRHQRQEVDPPPPPEKPSSLPLPILTSVRENKKVRSPCRFSRQGRGGYPAGGSSNVHQ